MILDRVGVINDEISDELLIALDWIVDHGLQYVEIRMIDGINVSNLNDEQVDHTALEVSKRGLKVSGIASPLFKCSLDPTREVETGDMFGSEELSVEDHFQKLTRTIEIAKKFNTNKIRIFSFWREKDPGKYENEVVTHLKRAAKIAEKENIVLMLENEGSCNGGFAKEVASIVHKVNSPALKSLWDPGNEQHGGAESYPKGYQEVKEHLIHVHLKDAIFENGRGKCVPISRGQVPYKEQILALENDGYEGLYVIETHFIPDGGTKMDGTKMTLNGLKNLLEEENEQ